MKRYCFIAIIIFLNTVLISCSGESKLNDEQEKIILPDNYQLLEGRWQDTRDSSHAIIFHNQQWVDMYNNDTVSKNNITLFSNFPDRGGIESSAGTYIRLEESPGNFYYLIIKEMDSLRLNLDFVSADMQYSLYRISD